MAELLADFLAKAQSPIEHVVGRGVLPVAGKMILGGPPKSNKSFVILNMALALARGTPLFDARYENGQPVFPVYKRNRVLMCEQELGETGVQSRLRSMIASGQIDPKGLDFYIKTKDANMRLDTPEGRAVISGEISAVRPDVVFLDPMAKFHLVDENSAQHMGAVMRVVDRWIQDFGCAVVITHHTALASLDPDRHRRGGAKLRGSSAIFADCDTFVDVQRRSSSSTREPILQLEFEMRRGEPLEPAMLKRLRSGLIYYLGDRQGSERNERRQAPARTKDGFETPTGPYEDL
jgi:hypothetical protein